MNVKTEPEEDVKKETENDDPDRCIVCNERLTANQNCDTESETQSTFTAENSVGDGTDNETATNSSQPQPTDTSHGGDSDGELIKEDSSLDGVVDQCWKCSEIKTEPSEIETEPWSMDQSDLLFASHNPQSDVLEIPSVKEKRFKCNVCHKRFTKSGNLKLHIRTVHDKVKAFPCPHCPYKAAQSVNLEKHILTHTGEKNFNCDICDKKFALNSSLGVHIKAVHDKVRPFPCPHCPYKAAQTGHLEKHILTHTGEKNFKCDICDKTFSRASSLKQHTVSVHDDIKAFECLDCSYKATRIDHLERHILTHAGDKQFKCDTCDKTFAQNSHLKRHIRTVHDKIKAFPCPHCPYKATQSGNLNSHILTHRL